MTIRRITLGITGASGSLYAERLLDICINEAQIERIYLVASDAGKSVCQTELSANSELLHYLKEKKGPSEKVRVFEQRDLYAPIASGTAVADATVIVPCSMGTLGKLAHGLGDGLIERSFDVSLKEGKLTVVVPRETPVHAIHLENMLSLARCGTKIVLPSPGFYQRPQTIEDIVDFVCGRILQVLGLEHRLFPKWNQRLI